MELDDAQRAILGTVGAGLVLTGTLAGVLGGLLLIALAWPR
jgi:hypothetical protein